ncbi:hypothetical protein [Leptolyngbya sp. 7M]|uniref:hypothetical protein n=1 Tax=Leptolyngbya sp. 7M TaxID=2812896 RepID=UPI001B8D6BA5|nr:hypothetical protein [Leptolyngbya sp. 7M]QYO68906.1 hypothetical protein JVX88_30845 [Leptolyngbya sp. 7M]
MQTGQLQSHLHPQRGGHEVATGQHGQGEDGAAHAPFPERSQGGPVPRRRVVHRDVVGEGVAGDGEAPAHHEPRGLWPGTVGIPHRRGVHGSVRARDARRAGVERLPLGRALPHGIRRAQHTYQHHHAQTQYVHHRAPLTARRSARGYTRRRVTASVRSTRKR